MRNLVVCRRLKRRSSSVESLSFQDWGTNLFVPLSSKFWVKNLTPSEFIESCKYHRGNVKNSE